MQIFLEKLIERLQADGFKNHEEYARAVGVDRSIWSRARHGISKLSPRIIAGGLARYPELAFYLPGAFQERKESTPAAAGVGD